MQLFDRKLRRCLWLVVALSFLPVSVATAERCVRSMAERLPLVQPSAIAEVASEGEVPLRASVDAGWKWNAHAFSWVALFLWPEKTCLGDWQQKDLENDRVRLPRLSEGRHYRLQGTFYYCHDTHGQTSATRCVLQSLDQEIVARPGGAKEWRVSLRAER